MQPAVMQNFRQFRVQQVSPVSSRDTVMSVTASNHTGIAASRDGLSCHIALTLAHTHRPHRHSSIGFRCSDSSEAHQTIQLARAAC